jgi:enoyl-CoA hydratase/carnithine racemase
MSKANHSSYSGTSHWSKLSTPKIHLALMRNQIGITMTLPMTIRLAWEGSKIGFVFSQRGVVMEAASSFFLPRLIGHSSALYLTTTGSTLPESSPHFGALFHELLPSPEDALPRALELAEQIVARTSTVSTYLMRVMM